MQKKQLAQEENLLHSYFKTKLISSLQN